MTMKVATVLITGASSGIGLELAHVFAEHGDNLVLVARDSSRLTKLAKTLSNQYGLRVEAICLDLTKPDAIPTLIKSLKDEDIQIDTLVNNAGFGLYGEFAESDWKKDRDMIDLNIRVVTELASHFVTGMKERGQGRILNVASTAAFLPGPMMAVYYATKSYVLSWSVALSEELRGDNIVVTALCPGPTKTSFATNAKATKSPLFKGKLGSANSVARAGYRGLVRGKAIVVPGWKNKLLTIMPRLFSRRLQAGFVRRAS